MGRKLQLAIVIFDKLTVLDAIGPYDVLQILPNVEVVFVSHKAGPYFDMLGQLSLNATASFDDVPHPDIVLVPGGPAVGQLLSDLPLLDWIRKVHETTLFTTSVCTGSLLLGAAGLLKGINATSHWIALDELAKYGAKISKSRVVQDGKIITGAGVSSGIELGLKLASLISNDTFAKTVQLMIEYDPQPEFDTGSVEKAGAEIVEKARSLEHSIALQIQLSNYEGARGT